MGASIPPPRGSADDPEDVAFLHDEQVFAVDLDLGARPLAEQDAVAGLDVERGDLALLVLGARADGDDFEKGEVTPLDVKAGDRILFGKWSPALTSSGVTSPFSFLAPEPTATTSPSCGFSW